MTRVTMSLTKAITLSSVEAAQKAGLFDDEAFSNFANRDEFQALFSEADLDRGLHYEEAKQDYIDHLWNSAADSDD